MNNIINQFDLIDTHRTLIQQLQNTLFFLSAQGAFTKVDHILGNKTSLSKFQRTETIQSMFSEYHCIKLGTNINLKNQKIPNIWILKNTLLT